MYNPSNIYNFEEERQKVKMCRGIKKKRKKVGILWFNWNEFFFPSGKTSETFRRWKIQKKNFFINFFYLPKNEVVRNRIKKKRQAGRLQEKKITKGQMKEKKRKRNFFLFSFFNFSFVALPFFFFFFFLFLLSFLQTFSFFFVL